MRSTALPAEKHAATYARLMLVARLYRIMLARAPDLGGLRHYEVFGDDKTWRADIAADLLRSTEFGAKVGTRAPADWLCGNALGRDANEQERAMPLADLALTLARDEDLAQRSSGGQAFFEGVSVADRALYKVWLAGLRAHRTALRVPGLPTRPGPLLSVIVARTSAPFGEFEATMKSVAAQSEAGAETVVAVGPAVDDETRVFLASAGTTDVRIAQPRWRRSPTAALGKALRAARGEFVCLLDEGDRLDTDCVAEIAAASGQSDVDVILSGEDLIGDHGEFCSPVLNAGWDPDAALARPPTGLLIIRASVLRAIGGFRAEAVGAHAWDHLLRSAERIDAARIVHIAAPLLHRSVRPLGAGVGTPAPSVDIVRGHLGRTGRGDCRIDGDGRAAPIRVVYPVPAEPPMASIIIATRDAAGLLDVCLQGLRERTAYPAMEILLVDHDTRGKGARRVLDRAKQDPRVRVLQHGGPFNWSALSNAGVAAMRGDVAVLLDNDTDVIEPDWLREMVSHAIRPSVGIVGAKLLYSDRTIQHAGMGLGAECRCVHVWRHADGVAPGYQDQLRIVRTVSAVTGACLAIRRSVFDEVGGLDQENLRVTWSDVDLCLRVRAAGYRVVWTPQALLYHVELGSRGSDDEPAARPRFLRESAFFRETWRGIADRDPYRSPHLSLSGAAPQLASRFIDDRRTAVGLARREADARMWSRPGGGVG